MKFTENSFGLGELPKPLRTTTLDLAVSGTSMPPLLMHIFYSFGNGGAQTRCVRIANHFGPRLAHAIVALNGDYSKAPQFNMPVQLLADRWNCDIPFSAPRRFSQIARTIRRTRPDFLVTHNWGSMEWVAVNRTLGVPHIHIEDGFGPDEANRQKQRRLIARRLLLGRSRVVVPSYRLREIAMTMWRVPPSRLHFIPNGVDPNRFSPPVSYTVPAEPRIGTVAALRPEKNIQRLLQAFALVNRKITCRLVVAGDGAERQELEKLSKDLGIADRVSFTGNVDDPSELYRSLTAFALTSDTEQMPFTILEAMAVGLPIVGTKVGDIEIMVSKENHRFLADCTSSSVANRLLQVLTDYAAARRAGDANRNKVLRDYTEEATFGGFAKLYGLEPQTPFT